MTSWLWVLGALYLIALVLTSFRSWEKTKTAEDYLMAGSSVGVILGFLTFAATLFSTFTLMGMPDFFRVHGVGAWIFLAVSDGVAFFLIIWFGSHLRRRVAGRGFRGIAGLMNSCYNTRWAGCVYFAGVFLFLVPYVAIQIRGIAIFLSAAFPDALPAWGWSLGIVAVMLVYSEIGGLRAIIYSDAVQGLLLLARVSFAGTSLLGPMVLAAVFSRHAPGPGVVVVTALGLLLFLSSLLGVLPERVGPVRMDLFLLLALGLFTLASVGAGRYRSSVPA